ncbi:hypothetical protein G6F64_000870 [Rhizopus arrhizus]|uniref:Ricin B lectin domain-containing protein n=1 Tax=Rhizopus oryzae TaxID=64495 RepID=A0A9P6XJL9_RHIOR|nr:hypothetical protein G6F23_012336 [Rhizopus arrhizus]KAG1315193.1 hypothetical protein G6F64_000870 [Rhizopus arrhizus]
MSTIPSGPFFIVSKLNGRVLDVKDGSIENAAPIIVWSKKSSNNQNQLWFYRSGYFVNINSEKVLDVKGNKIEKNASIIQYDAKQVDESNLNQLWSFDPYGCIYAQSNPGLVLDIKDAQDKDGAEVILYERKQDTMAANQLWQLIPA